MRSALLQPSLMMTGCPWYIHSPRTCMPTLLHAPLRPGGVLPAQFKQQLEGLLHSGQAHPKMARLHGAVLAHFRGQNPAQDLPSEEDGPQGDPPNVEGGQAAGRVIVFTSFRDSVGAIVDMFKAEAPLISARHALCALGTHAAGICGNAACISLRAGLSSGRLRVSHDSHGYSPC